MPGPVGCVGWRRGCDPVRGGGVVPGDWVCQMPDGTRQGWGGWESGAAVGDWQLQGSWKCGVGWRGAPAAIWGCCGGGSRHGGPKPWRDTALCMEERGTRQSHDTRHGSCCLRRWCLARCPHNSRPHLLFRPYLPWPAPVAALGVTRVSVAYLPTCQPTQAFAIICICDTCPLRAPPKLRGCARAMRWWR